MNTYENAGPIPLWSLQRKGKKATHTTWVHLFRDCSSLRRGERREDNEVVKLTMKRIVRARNHVTVEIEETGAHRGVCVFCERR